MEERDGGVFIEVEAAALSRYVPRATHVIADPVIRRVKGFFGKVITVDSGGGSRTE